jgi:hypothetical protein
MALQIFPTLTVTQKSELNQRLITDSETIQTLGERDVANS